MILRLSKYSIMSMLLLPPPMLSLKSGTELDISQFVTTSPLCQSYLNKLLDVNQVLHRFRMWVDAKGWDKKPIQHLFF